MQQTLLVMTNVPDTDTAQRIARALVEQRLAACVNSLPGVHSVYRWQGAVEEAAEITLLIKTVHERYDALEAAIKTLHPYDVPEILAVPIAAGLPAYLGWVAHETKKDVDV
ncbi:divalent-cation tolerance protein CutA [Oxalobacteraceae bacterium OM1]|nr:divalent-cation tolerance protein CutA [Oxalobacteraceae bacterium OM1]